MLNKLKKNNYPRRSYFYFLSGLGPLFLVDLLTAELEESLAPIVVYNDVIVTSDLLVLEKVQLSHDHCQRTRALDVVESDKPSLFVE